jgi:succinoglycan biosynthesis transport protein ExoP
MQVQPTPTAEGSQESHLWDYLYVVWHRRRLVSAIFLAATAAVTARAFLTRPVYQATAQILIERDSPKVLSFKEVAEVDGTRDDYFQTQYKLLQSRSLAERVIRSLGLLRDPEFGGPRSESEEKAILESPPGQSPQMEDAITLLLRRQKVVPIRNSRLVTVTFESYRADLAARVTNTLAHLYIQQALDFRFQTSSEASQWLGAQIDEQRKKVEELDASLQRLKEREGIVNIEERRTLLEQRLRELGTELNRLKTARLEREALYRQMVSVASPEELPEVMRNPLVQSLRGELAALERQLAQTSQRFLEQHPESIKLRNQIDETRAKIRTEAGRIVRSAQHDYEAAAAQEASVAVAIEKAKAETLDLSRRGLQYDSLRREQEAARQVLNGLIERAKQTDVAQELKSTNIRVVDLAAVPRSPARPRRVRDILIGMILAAGLAVAAAFFLDYLDNTIKTPDDVRAHLGVPLLGVVPEQTDRSVPLVISGAGSQTQFGEGYSMIRTALHYSWSEPGARVVLVTSTAQGEGKTLTAVNLALALSALEARVLLVDADFRRPQTHGRVKARRTPGLADVLVGKVKSADAIVHRVADSNLSYLASGTPAPSPADLFSTRSMRGLLDGLRSFYEWVVIDSPPVPVVAEALVLAPLCDGVVVVAGAEMVTRRAIKYTLERIRAAGARILGVVLNRAMVDRHSYYYRHYYGQDYGRIYGREDHGKKQLAGKVARINGDAARRRFLDRA